MPDAASFVSSNPQGIVQPESNGVLPIPSPACDDHYSDRLRCDHPEDCDPAALAQALLEAAQQRGRGRVVVLTAADEAAALGEAGFQCEGVMPGFYRGEQDCAVMGAYPDASRATLARPAEVQEVRTLLDADRKQVQPAEDLSRRAVVDDAPAVAALLGQTFAHYPTPSHDPEYVAEAISEGQPFRVIESGGSVVACASADLVRDAKTAELTDCATRPEHRGRGYMQAILSDLMDDLRTMGYPTAFTLARAAIPGVNLAFQRLGFAFRGCMPQSCRIGDGLEDMNIFSRRLDNA